MHTSFGRGGGEILSVRIIHGDNFPHGGIFTGRNFPGCEFFSRNFTLGEFSIIVSCSLFANSISRVEMLMVIVQSKFSPGLNFLENIFVGRRNFSVELEPCFLALSKKIIRN